MRYAGLFTLAALLLAQHSIAGPYAPAAGQPDSTAIFKDDAAFVGWATGYSSYLPGPNVDATWQTPQQALGKAVGDSFDIVALGDGGTITLTFSGAIFNGPGADFAVFENSFSDTFLELAWVEVSSDNTNFYRFPGVSFTAGPIGGFGSIDPTNIDGFAGKYRQGYGTPFDLDLLSAVPGLNVNDVRYVRIVDITGDGSVLDNYPPALGGPHPVYDPFPTSGGGGFDLDAIGVIHLAAIPEPSSYMLTAAGLLALIAARHRRRRGA